MKQCLQKPVYSCVTAPHSGGGVSGHRTSTFSLYFWTWSSLPTHLPTCLGILFNSDLHNLHVTAGFAMTEVGLLLSFTLFITILQALLCFSCDFYPRTEHPLQYKICLLPLGSESDLWFPKLGFHSLV